MEVQLLVSSQTNQREVTIEYIYEGKSVRDSQYVNKFTLYYMGEIIHHTPDHEIELYQGGRISFVV